MTDFKVLPMPPAEVAGDLFLYGSASGDGERAQAFPEGEHPPCFVLIAAATGEGAATIDREAYPLTQGELLIVPCREQVRMTKGLGYSAVMLGGAVAQKYLGLITDRLGTRLPEQSARLSVGTLRRLHNSVALGAAHDGCWSSAKAYAILMELYALTQAKAARETPPIVEQALEIIRSQYAYLAGVEDVADRLSVSKHHLIRLFSQAEGISPGKYLTQIRLENACLLLQSGRYKLESVANMVGFAGANYFCKVFKKEMGMTPSEYAGGAAGAARTAETEKLEQIFYL